MQNKNKVFAIGRGILFSSDPDRFEGYRPISEVDYTEKILKEATFTELGGDEKQICPYIVFINPNLNGVYTFYRRESIDSRISFFIEGIVNLEDVKRDNLGPKNPLKECVLREARKQIQPQDGKVIVEPDPIGFVNFQDARYGSKFGLVYVALVQSKDIRANPRKTRVIPISGIDLKNISELESLCGTSSVDKASKTLFNPLKEHIENFC